MVVNHNRSACGQNMAIVDVVAYPWIKFETSFDNLYALG
jgi:hypothetical protein